MALTTLQKLAQARMTGTPGNFARANTQAGIYTFALSISGNMSGADTKFVFYEAI